MSYKLVNPDIEGSFDKILNFNTVEEAANTCWLNLSKYLANEIPTFAFTLQDTKTGGFYHFKVKETKKDGKVNYAIKNFNTELSEDELERLDNELGNFLKNKDANSKQTKHKVGAGKHGYKVGDYDNDDDDDSDSDDSYFHYHKYKRYPITPMMPITYWRYYPMCYRIGYIYIPNFIAPLTPYVSIFNYWY